jgi:hypothetical protein
LCVLAIVCGAQAVAQADKKQSPKVSDAPLTRDELAIYHAVLDGWISDTKKPIFLSNQTVPLDVEHEGCGKNAPTVEKADPAMVHRFRNEDIAKLGRAKLTLVDPEAQKRQVAENDPGKAIREGKPVDDAVKGGLAHGLVSLSEVRFDEKHVRAIVWYGFVCGSLCGDGATVVMEKQDSVWTRKGFCSIWMSRGEDSGGHGDWGAVSIRRAQRAVPNA